MGTVTGIDLILAERKRQIEVEGFDVQHDKDMYWEGANDELLTAANCYLCNPGDRGLSSINDCPLNWPWSSEYWKPVPSDRVRELIKGGALLVAYYELIGYGRAALLQQDVIKVSEDIDNILALRSNG